MNPKMIEHTLKVADFAFQRLAITAAAKRGADLDNPDDQLDADMALSDEWLTNAFENFVGDTENMSYTEDEFARMTAVELTNALVIVLDACRALGWSGEFVQRAIDLLSWRV